MFTLPIRRLTKAETQQSRRVSQARYGAMMNTDQEDEPAQRVGHEAYLVIGEMARATGIFDHPEVQRALDYFGHEQWRAPGGKIIPFAVGRLSPWRSSGALCASVRTARNPNG